MARLVRDTSEGYILGPVRAHGTIHARGEVLQGNLTLRIEDEGRGLQAARPGELGR